MIQNFASLGNPLTGSYGSGSSSSSSAYPSPWLDYATTTVPDSHDLILWWAQYLWMMDGNYRAALERVAAHFMTSIEFPDLDAEEENTWKDFFLKDLDYRSELLACAHDYLAYGNLIVALYMPFKRIMVCQGCGFEQPIDRVEYELNFTDKEPNLIWARKCVCPACGDKTPYKVDDRRDADLSRVKLNRYSPMDIELAANRHSGRKDIYWKISEDDRSDYNRKARIHIDDTPMEVLQAVAVGGKLRFNEDIVLHVGEVCISGIRNKGWGIPRTIANFRSAWMQQVYNKADQAVALDYTLGIRTISPAPTPGGFDPMQNNGMQEFSSNVRNIIGEHRKNPATYHTIPYPLQYTFMGGEGGTLIPPEKLKFRQAEFLNQMGVPVEYFQMNMTAQAAPMALRMFETYWQAVPAFYNKILGWMVNTLTNVYGLEATEVKMQKTTVVDDAQYKSILLQLMTGNQLSPQTALTPLGIDAHNEVRKVYKHQDFVQRIQREFDEQAKKRDEMSALSGQMATPGAGQYLADQQAQQQGAPPPSGVPMGGPPLGGIPGSGATPQSLQEISDQAEQIAEQLFPLQDSDRKPQLKQLRDSNKELHALVMQALTKIRTSARSQGQQMIQQQAMQGGPTGQ